MSHRIVHWEIMGPDGAALRNFYSSVFGWGSDEVPGFDQYYMTTADDSGVAGAIGKGGDMGAYLTMYVEVDSIDEHLAKVEAEGGSTVMPRTVVPETVVFGLFSDPAGNLIGVVERDTPTEA